MTQIVRFAKQKLPMAGMTLIKILLMCQIFVTIDSANDTTTSPKPVPIEINQRILEVATRIVGGKPANIKTYPYAVSIQWRLGSKHHCGGSYIMPRFILSAAHCMVRFNGQRWTAENPKFYLILAGSSNLWYSPTWQIAVTDAVLPHPDFNYGTMSNDIGLYRIVKPFRITSYVNYAPLPAEINSHLFENTVEPCMVIGWGKVSESSTVTSDILQHASVPLISTKDCGRYFTQNLHSAQICAGKKEGGTDACQGDSGGPLVCDNVQVGIVSWGHGCAAPMSPGVYCRVDQYTTWIKHTMLKNEARSSNVHDFSSIVSSFLVVMSFYSL